MARLMPARKRGKPRIVKSPPLTEWTVSEDELLERIERALAEAEAEKYREYVKNLFVSRGDEINSIPVEEISRRTGISPKRIIDLVGKHQSRLGFRRIKCPSSSRFGWCLAHWSMEDGISLVDERIIEQADFLLYLKRKIWRCTMPPGLDPSVLPLPDKIIYQHVRCDVDQGQLLDMLAKATLIAEELGIDPKKLEAWLGLEKGTVLWLRDGERMVYETV